MKQIITLKSTDRVLFGVTVKQNTEGYLSITDLQKSYETARWQYGWSERSVSSVMQTIDFKERLYHLLYERDLIKLTIVSFMEMIEKEGIAKVLKGLNVYKTTGRGLNKTTVADPYIWVLLAMELNPMLYAKVVMWLTDSLIFNRIEAGDSYKPMNSAINSIIEKPNYQAYAKAINENVFGHHLTGMRNIASIKELRKIANIENFIIGAIDNGWLKTDSDVLKAIKTYK